MVGDWWLVIGGWWLVAVGSGWQLAVGRRWRLAAVGGWQLVAVGGWRLAVGGPLGRSLRAVLSKKKKSRPLRTALYAHMCEHPAADFLAFSHSYTLYDTYHRKSQLQGSKQIETPEIDAYNATKMHHVSVSSTSTMGIIALICSVLLTLCQTHYFEKRLL